MSDLTHEVESVRPGFSAFIAGNGEIEEYHDGQVMALRRMLLNDTTDVRTKRLNMRRHTIVEVNGTIYGRKHTIRTDAVAHSPSGLNVQFTTLAGHPDPEALQRINRMVTQFTTSDTYENYVALFFSFFSLAWTIEHVDKNTQHCRNINFGPEVLEMPQPGLDPQNYWNRAIAICQGNAGLSIEEGALPFGDLGNGRIANFRAGADRRRNVQGNFWEVPSYDDGHTQITSSRFGSMGFVNQRYVVNNCVRSELLDLTRFTGSTRHIPDDNAAAAEIYFNNRFFIRSEGFTDADFWIVGMAMYNRKRSTPFLCDQTIPIASALDRTVFVGHTPGEVQDALERFTGVRDPNVNTSLRVTFDDVMKTMNKVVAIHRCYDDLAVARDLFDNYVIQPDPSTVEAHVYPNIKWITDLPRAGMRRAAIGPLLAGTPALMAPNSLVNARMHQPIRRLQTSLSLLVNTCWQWGEYLQAAQHAHWDEAVYALVGGKVHAMEVDKWMAIVISAVVGQEQPTGVFPGVGTRYALGFEANFGQALLRIDNNPVSRELDRTSEQVAVALGQGRRFKYTVPPANAAQIAGMAGTLTMFTPYSPTFQVEKAPRMRARNGMVTRTDRLNVWNIGVAVGTGTMCDTDFTTQYSLFNILERDNVFGDAPTELLEDHETREFAWNNGRTELKVRFGQRNYDSAHLGARGPRSMVLFKQVQFDTDYVVAVRAEYNRDAADFRVERVTAVSSTTRPM